jgi:hypothetical protein
MKLGVVAAAVGFLLGASPAAAAPLHRCGGEGRWRCGKLSRLARAFVGGSVLSLPPP